MMSRLALVGLTMLVAQTIVAISPSYVNSIQNLLSILTLVLFVVIFPLLLIYGLLKATVDVFKKQAVKPALRLLPLLTLVAQTTTAPDFADQVYGILGTLYSVIVWFFMILIPGIAILLLWKAFTKLIKL